MENINNFAIQEIISTQMEIIKENLTWDEATSFIDERALSDGYNPLPDRTSIFAYNIVQKTDDEFEDKEHGIILWMEDKEGATYWCAEIKQMKKLEI